MKKVILMVDAAADFPSSALRDQTPLETARCPHARALAEEGRGGALKFTARQSSHSMSMLGEVYRDEGVELDRVRWGPLAGRSLGWDPDSSRYRALGHFVTCMDDVITCAAFPHALSEQNALLEALGDALRVELSPTVRLASFGKGRFVVDLPLLEIGNLDSLTPADVVGKSMSKLRRRLPAPLETVHRVAEEVLRTHAINQVRLDLGENPLNGIWMWSGGSLSGVTRHPQAHRKALVSCEPLALGLAKALGIEALDMENPYGLNQIDAAFDVGAFLEMMGRCDEITVWIPAPFARDQAEGPEEKVRRLDAIDYYVTGPIRAILEDQPHARLLLLSAGVRNRGRPEKGRAPFVLWGDGVPADETQGWHERDALRGALGVPKFANLLETLRRT
ncbi:MAG: hypothetical protein JJU29_03350 [Verrucomicrobia bacterium]|nr:hypothetical protein [Verrucomicrobiota bacterium]MCH8510726.1 hypothetical protein [Kiritimatiellia bacterium]